jgi:hypothetical protein
MHGCEVTAFTLLKRLTNKKKLLFKAQRGGGSPPTATQLKAMAASLTSPLATASAGLD